MVVSAAEEGKSHLMPTVNAGLQGYMKFSDVRHGTIGRMSYVCRAFIHPCPCRQINTCNTVDDEDIDLANRLQLWMSSASGVAATTPDISHVPSY